MSLSIGKSSLLASVNLSFNSILDNQWQHVAVDVIIGDKIRLYYNGVIVDSYSIENFNVSKLSFIKKIILELYLKPSIEIIIAIKTDKNIVKLIYNIP